MRQIDDVTCIFMPAIGPVCTRPARIFEADGNFKGIFSILGVSKRKNNGAYDALSECHNVTINMC